MIVTLLQLALYFFTGILTASIMGYVGGRDIAGVFGVLLFVGADVVLFGLLTGLQALALCLGAVSIIVYGVSLFLYRRRQFDAADRRRIRKCVNMDEDGEFVNAFMGMDMMNVRLAVVESESAEELYESLTSIDPNAD